MTSLYGAVNADCEPVQVAVLNVPAPVTDIFSAKRTMMTTITPIPAFKDNYIWLIELQAGAVVVDPGDAAPVLDYLKNHRLRLTAILITHHHEDHQGGIEALVAACGKTHAPRVFGPIAESIIGLTNPLQGGERLSVAGDTPFEVIATPGHTRGHLSYLHGDNLFCGDTLFAAGCGRLFEGTAEQMKNSLDRLAALPGDPWIFCAHEYTLANLRFAQAVEPDNADIEHRILEVEQRRRQDQPSLPSSMSEEKKTNPFLRYDIPAVVANVQRYLGSTQPLTPLEVFTALRAWKNVF